ncbi:MAG: hypothetical protein DMG28_12270 [Acidobacteria bacterium]|nr:MAG: hypothetical protein DMG28_12270 [Acidobacteriota bacterium]
MQSDRQEIVIPTFAGHPAQGRKSMELATDESFKALTVGELHIERAAVTLDQAEGIELPLVALIVESAEVALVNLEALARSGLHPHEGATRVNRGSQLADVSPQEGNATFVAKRS